MQLVSIVFCLGNESEHTLSKLLNNPIFQTLVWADFSIGYADTHLLMETIQPTQPHLTVLEDSFLMQMKENTLLELLICTSFTKWVNNSHWSHLPTK